MNEAEELKDLLTLSFVLVETFRQNLGLASFIDASTGTGLTHLGYTAYLGRVKKTLGSSTVTDGALIKTKEQEDAVVQR